MTEVLQLTNVNATIARVRFVRRAGRISLLHPQILPTIGVVAIQLSSAVLVSGVQWSLSFCGNQAICR